MIYSMTNKQAMKYIRDELREVGLVFKKSNTNNLYVVTDRATKEVVISNATLGGTLNNVCSGYFSCYDKEASTFNKEQLHNLGLVF